MAAALRPPDGVRLEFFGPVGGARLILAASGSGVVAIRPSDHDYDTAPSETETFDRLLGLPVDSAGLVSLLVGEPICPPHSGETGSRSTPAAGTSEDLPCMRGDVRFTSEPAPGDGGFGRATLRRAMHDEVLASIDYGGPGATAQNRWPSRISVDLPSRRLRIVLVALDGPAPGEVSIDLVSPAIPAGFERRPLLGRTGSLVWDPSFAESGR